MVHSEKKHRIIFIDLMRAFAVIQMVQGHTVDVLLAPEFRLDQYPAYLVWNFMRGMTAPIFMFSAGTVFTYLFRLVDEPFNKNPRVNKGFKRFLLLLVLGYFLRFPTLNIFNWNDVTKDQLDIFYAVDVLQLIGFGILFLMIFAFFSEKLKLNDSVIFSIGTLFFFFITPIVVDIPWIEFLPQFLAGYFYTNTGSLFPLFPWIGYVVAGGVLGSYLAKHPLVFKSNTFSFVLASTGAGLVIISQIWKYFSSANGDYLSTSYTLDTMILRVGFVILLNSIVSFISQGIEYIPKIIILVGRNTLLIYVVHLIILFGSVINPGIYSFLGASLGVGSTIFSALIMITIMTLMVYLLSKLKFRNKQLVT